VTFETFLKECNTCRPNAVTVKLSNQVAKKGPVRAVGNKPLSSYQKSSILTEVFVQKVFDDS